MTKDELVPVSVPLGTESVPSSTGTVTIWGCDANRESPMFDNVQMEVGYDSTDIWIAFNKAISAVQLTHAECRLLIGQLQEGLQEAERLRPLVSEEVVVKQEEGQEERDGASNSSEGQA